MITVNVHEAKTRLSQLLAQVEAGEEVIIARAGTPVARLVAIEAQKRVLGREDGVIKIPDDFDDPLPQEIWGSLFE